MFQNIDKFYLEKISDVQDANKEFELNPCGHFTLNVKNINVNMQTDI